MRLVVISEKQLESLIEAACTRIKDAAKVFPHGHLSTSPVGTMQAVAESELHDLRRAIVASELE